MINFRNFMLLLMQEFFFGLAGALLFKTFLAPSISVPIFVFGFTASGLWLNKKDYWEDK